MLSEVGDAVLPYTTGWSEILPTLPGYEPDEQSFLDLFLWWAVLGRDCHTPLSGWLVPRTAFESEAKGRALWGGIRGLIWARLGRVPVVAELDSFHGSCCCAASRIIAAAGVVV